MTFAYVAAVFCIASTPVAIGLGLAAWDDHRKRQQARRDFYLISEREVMCRALASSPRLRLPVEDGPAARPYSWVAARSGATFEQAGHAGSASVSSFTGRCWGDETDLLSR